MSRDAQALLEAFDHLPLAERDEVVQELLRRVGSSDRDALRDEELVSAADAVFTSYDQEESGR